MESRFQSYRGTWAWLVQRISAVCLFLLIPVKIYTGWAAKGKVPDLPEFLGKARSIHFNATIDILLLHSDGLVEHGKEDAAYFPHHLERKLREVKHQGAREIFDAVKEDLQAFAKPSDDISIVVIKRGEHGVSLYTDNSIFTAPGYPVEDVRDPTGAGDSFAGGFMGHLTSSGDLSEANLRRATVFGSVIASFTVEDFGLRRGLRLTHEEISARFREFKQLSHFDI